jgi:type II secretory pathway component PulC
MRAIVLALGALALGLSGCGGASPAPASPASQAPPPVASRAGGSAAPVRAPDHSLARSAVHAVVAQGLGAFLQHVELDDTPALVGGKFRGFRIAALRDGSFWTGVDLKAGDVVTGVNGFPIERPEQAQKAFESLEVSSELRVSYERNGEPREIVYAIVNDR